MLDIHEERFLFFRKVYTLANVIQRFIISWIVSKLKKAARDTCTSRSHEFIIQIFQYFIHRMGTVALLFDFS